MNGLESTIWHNTNKINLLISQYTASSRVEKLKNQFLGWIGDYFLELVHY